MAKRWTQEEDELLLKLRAEGFTAREMTLKIDRSYDSIRTRIATLAQDNLRKPWTEEDKEKAIKLKEQGRTNKSIAYELDRTPTAVSAFFNRLNKL